jgi:hypothetical protein
MNDKNVHALLLAIAHIAYSHQHTPILFIITSHICLSFKNIVTTSAWKMA